MWGWCRFPSDKGVMETRFVLPLFVCSLDGDAVVLTCHVTGSSVLSDFDCLFFDVGEVAVLPITFVDMQMSPSKSGWVSRVDFAKSVLRASALDKVVLSRQATCTMLADMDPWQLVSVMRAEAFDSFVFGVQFEKGRAFVGCSPELLLRREGEVVFSEAIAGTRPRSATDRLDGLLADHLKSSGKDVEEQRIVLDMLRQAFSDVCVSFESSDFPSVLKLQHVQHLHHEMEGVLRDVGMLDSELVLRLYPTPAVSGYPKDAAISLIDRLEPAREAYAGLFGVVGGGTSAYVVTIRSAWVDGNRLRCCSGVGILPDSHPLREWDELDYKLRPLLSACGKKE